MILKYKSKAIRILRLTVNLTLFDSLSHTRTVLLVILSEQLRCFCVSWTIRVWIIKKGLNRHQYTNHVVDWTPFVLQNVHANVPVIVNVRVEHFGEKLYLGGLAWVVFSEVKFQRKNSTFPDAVVGSKNHSFPFEQRIACWSRLEGVSSVVLLHFLQILHEPALSIRRHFN